MVSTASGGAALFLRARAAWNCSGDGYSHIEGVLPLASCLTGHAEPELEDGASYGDAPGAGEA